MKQATCNLGAAYTWSTSGLSLACPRIRRVKAGGYRVTAAIQALSYWCQTPSRYDEKEALASFYAARTGH